MNGNDGNKKPEGTDAARPRDGGQDGEQDIWLDFTLGMDCFAEVCVTTTPESNKRRIRMRVPPVKLIPIVFLPGIMGSNLRLSKARQALIKRSDNISWHPDSKGDALSRQQAEAAARQLRLDPDEVEVDRYGLSTDAKKFEATGSSQSSDSRHANVPDDLADQGNLLKSDPGLSASDANHPIAQQVPRFSAAQKARARGWSEVMFNSYGPILKALEKQLNPMLHGRGESVSVAPGWTDAKEPNGLVGRSAAEFGGPEGAAPITKEDILKIGPCWYPVHAFGYNWLKSNGEEAKALAPMITRLVDTYNANGFDCPGVIIVSHSMGGLVSRALLHPQYGNIRDKVLGVVHGVMPTTGAAATYKRLRAGFEGSAKSGWNIKAGLEGTIVQSVLGGDGMQVTAVLANAPGGLELLPAQAYGKQWLHVKDHKGKKLGAALPREDAVAEIYNARPEQWWRLINPEWIDPAKLVEVPKEDTGKSEDQIGAQATQRRIINAMKFADSIADTFHEETYAHFGKDPGQKAWDEVTWKVVEGDGEAAGDPANWVIEPGVNVEDGKGYVRVLSKLNGIKLGLQLQPPTEAADGTVPVERSADKVRAKAKFVQTGYEHQASYSSAQAQAATLYGIVRIANQPKLAEWWAKKN